MLKVDFAWTAVVGNVPSGDKIIITMIWAETVRAAGIDLINDYNEITRPTPVDTADGNPITLLGRRTGLDADNIGALLRLDPFVTWTPTGLEVRFPTTWTQDRFEEKPPTRIISIGDKGSGFGLCHKKHQGEERVSVEYNIKTEDMEAGFLSFLGIGVEETKSIVAKTLISSSRLASQSEEFCTEVSLSAGGEPYKLRPFVDNVFRTFALVPVPLAISGVLLDSRDQPLPNETVKIMSGATTLDTQTDAAGRFWVFSDEIEPGPIVILSGSALQEVNFQDFPIREVKLRRKNPILDN
jgi:hypothetical protein